MIASVPDLCILFTFVDMTCNHEFKVSSGQEGTGAIREPKSCPRNQNWKEPKLQIDIILR